MVEAAGSLGRILVVEATSAFCILIEESRSAARWIPVRRRCSLAASSSGRWASQAKRGEGGRLGNFSGRCETLERRQARRMMWFTTRIVLLACWTK